MNLNYVVFDRSLIVKKFIIEFHCRCMSDPPLSDIDFKNKMAWV